MDIIFGSTVSGNQIITSNIEMQKSSFKTTFISENIPWCVDMVIGTSGSANSIQHYNTDEGGRWRSSLSAESFDNPYKGFIAVDVASTLEKSKCEIEFYNQDLIEHKSSIKVFLDYIVMDSWSPTYSTSIYLSNSGVVRLGNVNLDRNSTILEIDDISETIKLDSINLSVNGEVGFSGTYSTVDSIVTVTNGLITNISSL